MHCLSRPLPNILWIRGDESKLLVYRDNQITHGRFKEIHHYLEEQDLLVFNNAKVIPARMHFKRDTGATIEVLLIEPDTPRNYELNFKSVGRVQWKCIIGNLKKWKDQERIGNVHEDMGLEATLIDRKERLVEFSWSQDVPFLKILEEIGQLPLPPYLNRETEEADYIQYQTVYARNEGSVAAPTAGLHFTPRTFEAMERNGVQRSELTLHVGAGTFLPVKDENVLDHPMHREHFEVSREELKRMLQHPSRIAVGTTSLRVLESLYYVGLRLFSGKQLSTIAKLEPYEVEANISYEEALNAVLDHLGASGSSSLISSTEIMILPQYQVKSVKALITNFHLPESTLLMLIASVVGDHWKKIYQEALDHNYRFLSYGDSSLLFLD